MIVAEHAYIRTAEPDDAASLSRFYDPAHPRAAVLDANREPILPTVAELHELLGRKELKQGAFYAIEDTDGLVQGFCCLRGTNQEAGFGEASLMLADDALLDTPLAGEAMAFLFERGFRRQRLHRIVMQCLAGETALRRCLLRHGFASDGVLRDAVYAQGSYHGLESFTRLAPASPS